MIFTKTTIVGALILDIEKREDERGFFARSFCKNEFEKTGIDINIMQMNVSSNHKRGTLRGLHLQKWPFEEAKLVRCTKGAIFDVLVDLRKDSPTYLKWFGVELTEENFRMLYIPEGCAHGYLTLKDHTDVTYQVSQFYSPDAEIGFLWDDPAFKIQWPIEPVVISQKDRSHTLYSQYISTSVIEE